MERPEAEASVAVAPLPLSWPRSKPGTSGEREKEDGSG